MARSTSVGRCQVRIVVLGGGVIGSVYAGRLAAAGHQVAVLARGRRAVDLRSDGVVLEDAVSGQRTVTPVEVLDALDDTPDLVLVAVRRDQLPGTLPALTAVGADGP